MAGKRGRVVAVILARGGSKGLVRKNVRLLRGRPLIAYTIEAAKRAESVDRVLVSTDDDEIARVAESEGAEAPFRRPPSLAADSTTSEAALQHAVEWLRDRDELPSIVVYLQVTDPFRTPDMIDRCVRALDDASVDSAFMALETHKNYWRRTKDGWRRLADDIPAGAPRQQKEPLYREDTGLALATRASVLLQGRRLGDRCVVIPHHHPAAFVDIHSEADLHIAELMIERLGIRPNESVPSDV